MFHSQRWNVVARRQIPHLLNMSCTFVWMNLLPSISVLVQYGTRLYMRAHGATCLELQGTDFRSTGLPKVELKPPRKELGEERKNPERLWGHSGLTLAAGQQRRLWAPVWLQPSAVDVCMFFPGLCGFSLGSPASHSPKP